MASRRRLAALELPRAAQELVGRMLATPTLRKAPRGDGHPVLVMPGFTGSDGSTRVMRAYLRGLGYYVHAWRLGRNWGPTDYIIDGLANRFGSLSEEHGAKLTLVGHSLGGVFARELARRAPDRVRQVVTLGSPIRWRRDADSTVAPLYRSLRRVHSERVQGVQPLADDHLPGNVPLTAIFSRSDGVVHWRTCVFDPRPKAECIEVRGSHTGLIHNATSLTVVAERLAQPEGQWGPYIERDDVPARVWKGE